MKRKRTFTGWVGRGLITLLIACGLLLAAVPAWSLVDCAALADPIGDFDKDGLLNSEECSSVTLVNGMNVPSCPGTGLAGCINPNRADVFIILNQVSNLIPADPFKLVSASYTGLDVVLHVIPYSEAIPDNRNVVVRNGVNVVRAAQISESLAPATSTDTKIGTAQQGMLIDKATVYTQRIADKVNAACAEGSICKDSSGVVADTNNQNLIDLYIRHTMAHELGHILSIAPESNDRFDGYHWKAGSGFVMDQSIVYTARKGTVTLYITTDYAPESQKSLVVQ